MSLHRHSVHWDPVVDAYVSDQSETGWHVAETRVFSARVRRLPPDRRATLIDLLREMERLGTEDDAMDTWLDTVVHELREEAPGE